MAQIYYTKRTRQRKNKDGSLAPMPRCEVCKVEIAVGEPHKNVSTRSGSYFVTRIRCAVEPDWKPWELSSSLDARLQEVSFNFWEAFDGGFESVDDVESMLAECAEAVREIAEEKRESAQNIEDGFQHPTEQSDDLNQKADDLESWAEEIEGLDVPTPDVEDDAELTEDDLEAWREEVREAVSIVDDYPV